MFLGCPVPTKNHAGDNAAQHEAKAIIAEVATYAGAMTAAIAAATIDIGKATMACVTRDVI